MLGAYFDIEWFENYGSILFLDMNTKQEDIDAYIQADIDKDDIAKGDALARMNYRQFIFHKDQYDAVEFYEFMKNIQLLIGFNSIKFDNLILDYLYIIKDIVLASETHWWAIQKIKMLIENIISNNNINYRYLDEDLKVFQEWWTSIDLYTALFETVSRKSLKQSGINIKWYRIEDLPLSPNAVVDINDFSKIFDYNMNDVLITRALYIKKRKEFELRINISARYGISVLSSNRSSIADRLMAKFYQEYTGLKYFQFKDKRTPRVRIEFSDILNPKIAFITPQLQKEHEEILNTTFTVGNTYEKIILFREKGYKVATGGLHSMDRPALFEETTGNKIIRDCDVTSYYPALIANEQVCPAHLAPVAFLAIVDMIIRDRVAYKTAAKMLKKEGRYAEAEDQIVGAEALKIVANSGLFGKLGYDGWLHDLKAMYQVTLNGQLYLMMLVEQFEEAGIEVISANTDGILTRFNVDKESDYKQITKDWQQYTKLSLEFTDYIKYVRTSVNDYIAIKKEWTEDPTNPDNIKRKGDFITEIDLSKGFNAPVVAIALDNLFVNGIPIETTIKNHTDIYDYCISVKTGDAYAKQLHRVENGEYKIINLSKNLRYYVSNRGGTLLKHNVNDDTIANMIKGVLITPFNDYFKVNDMSEYDINYNYYIKRATDILLKIDGNYNRPGASRRFHGSKKKGVDQVGKLFDNI